MQQYRRSVTPAPATSKATTFVLFLTGGVVGVMSYYGDVTAFAWVLAVLLGVWFRDRFPRSEAAWRGAVTVVLLFVAGGLLGAIAYYGALEWTPALVGACLLALALAPAESARTDPVSRPARSP